MIDFDAFSKLVDEIMSLGYDEKTACRYARLIGDRPLTDEKGQILVMEDNKVLAKLKLKFFQEQ